MINIGSSNAQETSLAAFFRTFHIRIPVSVVERYFRSINFIVSIDFYHMEEVESRLVWISESYYEMSEVDVDNYANFFLESPKNFSVEGTSGSITETEKKRKSVVKKEVVEGSEFERARHENERINIQRDLEGL